MGDWLFPITATVFSAALGAHVDLVHHGEGIAALLCTTLGTVLGLRALGRGGSQGVHGPMARAMQGMAVLPVAGLMGVTFALLGFGAAQSSAMTWSMLLMAGSMGAMIGGALGPYLPVALRRR